jgi:PAS domain S-box-containing protein
MKNTPKDLQHCETNYRRLFETTLDGILILDGETQKIIDANPSIIELSEYSREELVGKELRETGLFKDYEKCRIIFEELRNKDYIFCEDFTIQTKTGKPLDVEISANIYRENNQRFIQCNLRDITKRKADREQRLQNSELLAQIAGKAARLGGWAIQLPERTLSWSDENCAIHEVPPGYQPTLEEGISYYPEEYREEVIRYVDACAQDGIPYDFELPKYTAKGRLIWVRSIGAAVRDAEGNIIGLQGAFQDITSHKLAQMERESLIEELQRALSEVKTLREFLPICSYCKKVRDDQNYWLQIENYISVHTSTQFSHGVCPDCYESNLAPQLEQLKQRMSDEDTAR